ncbi:MAG: hypothetical protein GY898_03095 [Proteobacteria bacterium]|nr:hypothetical protein [Pseudomonadota bacterium]
MPADLTVPGVARFAPCLRDTTTLVGLRGLIRNHPDHWRKLLRTYADPAPEITVWTTAREVLGTRFDQRCLPGPHTSFSTLGNPRSYARRLREMLPADLVLVGINEAALDRIEADLVGLGQSPNASNRMVAHLRTLVNEAYRQVGGQPKLPARRARRVPDDVKGVLPADVATIALASPLKVRAALVLLLLPTASLRRIVELSCEDVDQGRMVLLGNCWFNLPRFCWTDLWTLASGREPEDPLFPGRTDSGRASEQGLRRAIERNVKRALGFTVRPSDIKALGRDLRARSVRGNRLPNAVFEMTTWEEFAQLSRPASPPPNGSAGQQRLAVKGLRAAVGSQGNRLRALEAQQEGLRTEAFRARARHTSLAQRTEQTAKDVRQLRRDLGGQRSTQLDLITDVARLEERLLPGGVSRDADDAEAPPGQPQPSEQAPRAARQPDRPDVRRTLTWGDALRALMLLPDAAEVLDSVDIDDLDSLVEEFIRSRELQNQVQADDPPGFTFDMAGDLPS